MVDRPTYKIQREAIENALEIIEPPLIPTVLDKENPTSVVNMVPLAVATQMRRIPREWLMMDEDELRGQIWVNDNGLRAVNSTMPTFITDNRIRHAFWLEYHAAVDQKRAKMHMERAIGNVVTYATFYNVVMKNRARFAWILCPPTPYIIALEEMLSAAIPGIREIATMEVKYKQCMNPKGCVNYAECRRCPILVDPRLVMAKLHALEKIEARARGAIPQNINQRMLSVNLNKNIGQRALPDPDEIPTDMATIDERISELEQAILPPAQRETDIIDVSESISESKEPIPVCNPKNKN